MQSAVVLCGLPFSVIILLYMFGLTKAINQDLADQAPKKVINKPIESSDRNK